MYLADSHMHSIISRDSESHRYEMAEAAVRLGIGEICITDHYDVLDIDGTLNLHYDWTGPREEHRLAQEKWGDKVKIYYGIEVGNVPTDYEAAERVQNEEGLDQVICSVHNLSIEKGRHDFYDYRYKDPETCYAHLDDYFNTMLLSVKWNRYDTFGHIPYPLRYMRDRDGQNVNLDAYQDRIREILKIIAENGRCIEVNTKNWSERIEQDYVDVLKAYYELGGRHVSVGSDAHVPSAVGAYVAHVYDILRAIGFDKVTAFEKRKPHFIAL